MLDMDLDPYPTSTSFQQPKWDKKLILSSGSPTPSPATSMSCWAHLGCWNEVYVGSRSRSLWGVISMPGSCWDASSSEYEMSWSETESAIGSEGMFIPSLGLNGSCHDARTKNGMKWEINPWRHDQKFLLLQSPQLRYWWYLLSQVQKILALVS